MLSGDLGWRCVDSPQLGESQAGFGGDARVDLAYARTVDRIDQRLVQFEVVSSSGGGGSVVGSQTAWRMATP